LDWLTSPEAWAGLTALVALEVVLGIDNVIFISILAGRLPPERRARARTIGLALGVVGRLLLLLSLAWVMRLTEPLFAVAGHAVTGKGLILILGGLFLVAKSTLEIHHKLEGEAGGGARAGAMSFAAFVAQVVVLDVVFALDSVITAVGMVDQLGVMVAAVLVAVVVMIAFAGPVSDLVDRHPTLKMLALSFLVLIGVNLVAEGLGQHIPKGYTYFAMAFALGVELLNLKLRATKPASAAA
jgi:predicted tellurium resistance membrane protein TerC